MSNTSVAIGKAHVAGIGNVFFHGELKVVRDESGRVIVAVDGDVDAVAIELSRESAEALCHELGAAKAQIQPQQQLLADHHVTSLSFARKALGAAPTLADTLLQICESWPDQAEAERWRRAIAIEDYMSARDELARAGSGAA